MADVSTVTGAPPRTRVVSIAAFGVAIYLLGSFAVVLAPGGAGVAAWWPSAGLAVVAVARSRRDRWWYLSTLAVVSGLANITGGRPLLVAVGFALSNTLEAWIAGAVIAGRKNAALDSLGDTGRFVAGVALGAFAIGVGASVTVWAFTSGHPVDVFLAVVPSHATAVCLIAPFGLSRRSGHSRSSVEVVLIWAAVAAVTVSIFSIPALRAMWFLLVPFLLWSVVRLGMRTATAQLLAVGVVATSLTFVAIDARVTEGMWLEQLQLFIVTCSILVMTVGASLADRDRALRRSRATESTYRAGFADSVVAMMLVRVENGALRVTEANAAARASFGLDVGDTCGRFLKTEDGSTLRDVVAVLDPGSGGRYEMSHTERAMVRWFAVSISWLASVEGDAIISLQIVDTSQRHEAERRLQEMALVDQLTGLPNLSSVRETLAAEIEQAGITESPVALIALDISGFASINEVFGHTAGDYVLAAVATRLRSIAEPDETVARFGGDRFLLVCPNATSPAGALTLAERVWQITDLPIHLQGHKHEVRLSVGVAISEPGIDAEQLLSEADLAVSAAKAGGRKSITLYSAELRADAAKRLQTLAEVRTGMTRGEFEMFMQPVVDLATGRVTAAEALIRWRRSDGILHPPGEWLGVVEQSGLMQELGAWVLDESVRQASVWLATVGPVSAPAVHVNVSGSQFGHEGFADLVQATLKRHSYPPELLVIELTETFLARADSSLKADFVTLSALGVKLAADDFGTGYSPLARIVELPLHMIKIDRLFVKDVATDDRAKSIVAALVRMANELGLDVVAEGIETEEQRRILLELGCRTAQGYLWSPAVDAVAFEERVLAPLVLEQLATSFDG